MRVSLVRLGGVGCLEELNNYEFRITNYKGAQMFPKRVIRNSEFVIRNL